MERKHIHFVNMKRRFCVCREVVVVLYVNIRLFLYKYIFID